MSKTVDKDAKQLATKRGLPIEGAPWKLEHDQVFFRRYTRLLQSAPPGALRRMSPYLGELMAASCWEREAAEAHELKALAEKSIGKAAYGLAPAGQTVPYQAGQENWPAGRTVG